MIRGLNAGAREVPRKELDALTDHVKRYGAGGLVWAFVQEDGTWRSPTAKFLTEDQLAAVTAKLGGSAGDLLLIVADKPLVAATALGELRLELARRFDLVPPGRHDVLWVVDFPMFEWSDTDGRWTAMHHPFTAPAGDFSDPGAMLLARLRHRARRRRDRRRLHPYQPPRGAVRRSSPRSASPRRRPTRASASCSTRCASARRRTAASRWASTGSPRSWRPATRSAT